MTRPKKSEEDQRFTKALYVRMTDEQWAKLGDIARAHGWAENGGRAGSIRLAIDRLHSVLARGKR